MYKKKKKVENDNPKEKPFYCEVCDKVIYNLFI